MTASEFAAPDGFPPWMSPLVANIQRVPDAYRQRVPPELLAALNGQRMAAAAIRRGAARAQGPGRGEPGVVVGAEVLEDEAERTDGRMIGGKLVMIEVVA